MEQSRSVADAQPDELNELRALVKEFMKKIEATDAEIELLKGQRKEIYEEYSDRIDTKTLNQALRVLKIRASVERKHAFDSFMEILTDGAVDDV